MSDTPPDRDEASAAPEGPKNPWVRFIAWGILTPVLYVLSAGPMWWFLQKTGLPSETMQVVYYPLTFTTLQNPYARMHNDYVLWWSPIRP